MKYLAALLLIVTVTITGCNELPPGALAPSTERPTVNLPYALRQHNWPGRMQGGCCVHATMISLLRWQGRPATANWWRNNFDHGKGNGERPESMAAKCERAGLRFAYTSNKNDVAFLEWACSTRRGCGVTVLGARHMIALVHLDNERAGLLDNNDPARIHWVSRKAFLAEWFNSESWAITPIYNPSPPLPHR